MTNNDGWSALYFSAGNSSFDSVLYLLRQGIEIYSKKNSMKNVFHLSAFKEKFDTYSFVLEHFTQDYKDKSNRKQHMLNGKYYKTQVFYKYSTIFLHAMDNHGNTYLNLASEGNQSEVCGLLLKYDTEILFLLNKDDKTAREIAKEKSHKDVLNILKESYDRGGMFLYYF